VFNRHGVERTSGRARHRAEEIERWPDRDDEQVDLDRNVYGRLAEMLEGRPCIVGTEVFKKDSKITRRCSKSIRARMVAFRLAQRQADDRIEAIRSRTMIRRKGSRSASSTRSRSCHAATSSRRGVMKMVKVFVAVKRKISRRH